MLTRVLPAIVAVGVAVAGAVLWRISQRRRRLRPARWIVALLAVYGAATLIYASAAGITLRAALSGAVSPSVPYLLQGAFIGAFVILPLGWVASLLRAGFPRFRDGSAAPAAIQAIALTTCIALLFTSLPQNPGGSASTAMRSPQERLQALDRSLRAVEDSERKSPRDHWDPDYVVNTVGRDPQRLFAWVRDNTFWIPYRGVLRGPVGVLMDRQGNSLDRAILLATLLTKTGKPVRLARGELTAEQALRLLPELVARRRVYLGAPAELAEAAANESAAVVPARTAPRSGIDEELQVVSANFQPVAASLGATITVPRDVPAREDNQLTQQVAAESAGLLAAVQTSDPAKEWRTRFEAAVKALREHWWVQMQEPQGWLDLDLLNEPSTREPLAAVTETTDVEHLSPELQHEVAVRIVTEQFTGGSAEQHTALEYRFAPSVTIGQTLVLQFWPTAWIGDVNSGAVRRTVLDTASQDQWGAALYVGKQVVASAFLADAGSTAEETRGGEFGGLGSAVAGAFGAKTKPRELSAVWIEYEVRVPGEEPAIVRRTMFDLRGPAARAMGAKLPLPLDEGKKLTRSLALMMRTEILPVVSEVPAELVHHVIAQSVLGNRKLLTAVAGDQLAPAPPESPARPNAHGTTQESLQEMLQSSSAPASPLLSLAAARLQSASRPNPRFIARPNLFTSHRYFARQGEQIVVLDAIDIVRNEVAVELAEAEAFPLRVWQGVLDTNLEAQMFSGSAANVGEAFAGAKGWALLAPARRSALATSSLPDDSRQRITRDLDAGLVVVAPETAVQTAGVPFIGWWRIDPSTGDTLGIGTNGWGTSLTERANLTRMANTFGYYFLQAYALCMAFPLALNGVRIINERYFGGWHPSWTAPGPKSQDFGDIVNLRNAEARGCLLQSIADGFFATLPLLLITLRKRGARLAEEELEAAAEAAAARARTARGPCPARWERIPVSQPKLVRTAAAWPGTANRGLRWMRSARTGALVERPVLTAVFFQTKPGDCDSLATTVARPIDPQAPTRPVDPEPSTRPQGPPKAVEEAKKAMDAAKAAAKAASKEHFDAAQEYMRYAQNRPALEPTVGGPIPSDYPAPYDPELDKALGQRAKEKGFAARDANDAYEAAREAYKNALDANRRR